MNVFHFQSEILQNSFFLLFCTEKIFIGSFQHGGCGCVTGFLTTCHATVFFKTHLFIHWNNPERAAELPPPRPDRGVFFRAARSLIRKASAQWRVCAGAPAKLQVVTGSDGSLTLRAVVFIRVYSALCLAKINRVPWLLEGKSADSEHTFVQVVSRKCD